MNDFNKYEKIIIKDVKGRTYDHDRKRLKYVFIAVALIFTGIYFWGFHEGFAGNIKLLCLLFKKSIISDDRAFKIAIYTYNKMMLAIILLSLFVIFSLLAFFAFDILARNKIIAHYQKKLDELKKEIEEVKRKSDE